jgi:hypothetical protein
MGPDLRCINCGAYSGLMAQGWFAVRCDASDRDEPPELAFYCPRGCARAAFGVKVRRDVEIDE